MSKKRVVATFQFFVLTVVLLVISVFFEKELEPFWKKLENSDLVKEVVFPTPSPSVFGESTASESVAVITEVIDGDTVRLDTGKTVRYIGVDTPETQHPRIGQECFGKEASTANENLVLGKTVTLEKDVSETDRYGRLLRYVWLDGKMVNETLVKEGYAEASAYPPDIKHQELLLLAEREAREHQRGLWSLCEVSQ